MAKNLNNLDGFSSRSWLLLFVLLLNLPLSKAYNYGKSAAQPAHQA